MTDTIRHLYIHIPFCAAKCPYCAFVTHIGSLRLVEPYLEALTLELASTVQCRPGGPLTTMYFGGGTPGLLTPAQIVRLVQVVDRTVGIAADAEITLEAHPDTVDRERVLGWKRGGVTRLSLGIESMHPDELTQVGRRYRPEEVKRAVSLARRAGFDNINLDLMYGLPGQRLESWKYSLQAVLALEPQHLSLYPLSIEPRTVFHRRQREGRLDLPDDDTVVAMYDYACRTLRPAGFVHYEVANWALPDHASRHNLAYWHDREYYGIGVGAHAYLEPYRTENEPRLKRYIDTVSSGGDPVIHRELISPDQTLSETVMLGLRLLDDGLDLSLLRDRFGHDLKSERRAEIARLQEEGLLACRQDHLYLAERAVPVANEIWERLLVS